MNSIAQFLTHDHHCCDDFFVAAENHVCKGVWPQAQTSFNAFQTGMERHFDMEEQVLFSSFETKTGSTSGPTAMMRSEHQQIRGLIERMRSALSLQNKDEFLGHSETLNIMMQQHNLKEENILYPMTDQILGKGAPDVIEAMRKIEPVSGA